MATMPKYQTADSIAFVHTGAEPAHNPVLEVGDPVGVIACAERHYTQALNQSRTLMVVCFLVSTALAVEPLNPSPNVMIGLLAISLLSALVSRPLARRQFRLEVERTARAEGLCAIDAQRLAVSMVNAWNAKRNGGRAEKLT